MDEGLRARDGRDAVERGGGWGFRGGRTGHGDGEGGGEAAGSLLGWELQQLDGHPPLRRESSGQSSGGRPLAHGGLCGA